MLDGRDVRRICLETRQLFKGSVAACACCDELEIRLLEAIGEPVDLPVDPERPASDPNYIETIF